MLLGCTVFINDYAILRESRVDEETAEKRNDLTDGWFYGS
jgi:hypothetical protein